MELTHKVVLTIPLNELWTDEKHLTLSRGKHLNTKDISDLLRLDRIQFVIADVGLKLNWLALDRCYEDFKTTIRNHLIEDSENINLKLSKDNFAYLATLWENGEDCPIVLLEKYH